MKPWKLTFEALDSKASLKPWNQVPSWKLTFEALEVEALEVEALEVEVLRRASSFLARKRDCEPQPRLQAEGKTQTGRARGGMAGAFGGPARARGARARGAGGRGRATGGGGVPAVPAPDAFGLRALSAAELDGLRGRSVWELKPAWCQPWSILGAGTAAVGGADLLSPWLAGLVALPVAAWWYVFLFAYPQAFEEAVQEEAARRAAEGGSGGPAGGG